MTFPHNTLYQITPSLDGSVDTRFKDGSKPSSGTPLITLNTTVFQNLMNAFSTIQVGDVISKDLVTAFSGPGAAKAKVAITTISGDIATNVGWTITGTVLTATAGATHGGVLDITVTDETGQVYNFPSTQWTFNAVSGSDAMAPTVPLGVNLIPGTGGYSVFLDQATDGYDGTNTPSGVKEYRVYDNSNNSKIATITAPTPNKGLKMAANTVGSPTGTNTATQNKSVWTLVADGVGVYNIVAEEAVFEAVTLTGDQAVGVKLAKYTSAYQYSMAGIMVRESAAPDAVSITLYLHPNNNGIRAAIKTTQGGKAGNIAQVLSIDGPMMFSIERSGDNWTFLYSQDGLAWKVLATATQSMSTSPLWGTFACSRNPGNPITAVFTDFNIYRKPTINKSITTAVTQSIYLTSMDIANNESGKSSIVTYNAPAGGGGTGQPMKVIQGNIVWHNNQYLDGAEMTAIKAAFPGYKTNKLIKGLFVSITFGGLNPTTTPGDLTQGFALLDQLVGPGGLCSTADHPMAIMVEIWQTFFNTTSTGTKDWSAYQVNNGWVKKMVSQSQNRTQLDWDNDAVWEDVFTNYCKPLLQRYNGNQYFAGLSMGDESEAVTYDETTKSTIMNAGHYCTKYQELMLRMKAISPNMPVYVPFNYIPYDSSFAENARILQMINAFEAAYPNGFIYGGPDPFVRQTTFQKLVAGLYPTVSPDIRSKLLIMQRVQGAFLIGKSDGSGGYLNPGTSPTQLYDSALANNCVTIGWNNENYGYYKWTDELAAITAHNGQVGTPPIGPNYQFI